jgi:hypothetical protein
MLSELKYFAIMSRIVRLDTPGLLHHVIKLVLSQGSNLYS